MIHSMDKDIRCPNQEAGCFWTGASIFYFNVILNLLNGELEKHTKPEWQSLREVTWQVISDCTSIMEVWKTRYKMSRSDLQEK